MREPHVRKNIEKISRIEQSNPDNNTKSGDEFDFEKHMNARSMSLPCKKMTKVRSHCRKYEIIFPQSWSDMGFCNQIHFGTIWHSRTNTFKLGNTIIACTKDGWNLTTGCGLLRSVQPTRENTGFYHELRKLLIHWRKHVLLEQRSLDGIILDGAQGRE